MNYHRKTRMNSGNGSSENIPEGGRAYGLHSELTWIENGKSTVSRGDVLLIERRALDPKGSCNIDTFGKICIQILEK